MISRKCKYCNKSIRGFNYKHIEELMAAHIFYKHKDKIKFNDKLLEKE